MLKKVFNWSEVRLSEVTSYKIQTLIEIPELSNNGFLGIGFENKTDKLFFSLNQKSLKKIWHYETMHSNPGQDQIIRSYHHSQMQLNIYIVEKCYLFIYKNKSTVKNSNFKALLFPKYFQIKPALHLFCWSCRQGLSFHAQF